MCVQVQEIQEAGAEQGGAHEGVTALASLLCAAGNKFGGMSCGSTHACVVTSSVAMAATIEAHTANRFIVDRFASCPLARAFSVESATSAEDDVGGGCNVVCASGARENHDHGAHGRHR